MRRRLSSAFWFATTVAALVLVTTFASGEAILVAQAVQTGSSEDESSSHDLEEWEEALIRSRNEDAEESRHPRRLKGAAGFKHKEGGATGTTRGPGSLPTNFFAEHADWNGTGGPLRN